MKWFLVVSYVLFNSPGENGTLRMPQDNEADCKKAASQNIQTASKAHYNSRVGAVISITKLECVKEN